MTAAMQHTGAGAGVTAVLLLVAVSSLLVRTSDAAGCVPMYGTGFYAVAETSFGVFAFGGDNNCTSVFVTRDGGVTWSDVSNGTRQYVGYIYTATASPPSAKPQYLAAANFDTLMTSDDGIHWEGYSPPLAAQDILADIIYYNDGFLALTMAGTFYSFAPHQGWNKVESEPLPQLNTAVSMAVSGKTLCVSLRYNISCSTKGYQGSWSYARLPQVPPNADWNIQSIAASGETFVAVGYIEPWSAGLPLSLIFTSTDAGRSWSMTYNQSVDCQLTGVDYVTANDSSLFVVSGTDISYTNTVLLSSDGVHWTVIPGDNLPDGDGNHYVYAFSGTLNGTLVAVGAHDLFWYSSSLGERWFESST